jgi:hypothetical protein
MTGTGARGTRSSWVVFREAGMYLLQHSCLHTQLAILVFLMDALENGEAAECLLVADCREVVCLTVAASCHSAVSVTTIWAADPCCRSAN